MQRKEHPGYLQGGGDVAWNVWVFCDYLSSLFTLLLQCSFLEPSPCCYTALLNCLCVSISKHRHRSLTEKCQAKCYSALTQCDVTLADLRSVSISHVLGAAARCQRTSFLPSSLLSPVAKLHAAFFFLYEDNRNVTQPRCKLLTSELDGQVCVSTAQCALQIRCWTKANCRCSVSYYLTWGEQTRLDRTEGGHMGSLQMESFHFADCNKLCKNGTDDEKWWCFRWRSVFHYHFNCFCIYVAFTHVCELLQPVCLFPVVHTTITKVKEKKLQHWKQLFASKLVRPWYCFFFCCLIAIILTAEAWMTHRYRVVPKKWFMTTTSLAITFEMLGPSSSLLIFHLGKALTYTLSSHLALFPSPLNL